MVTELILSDIESIENLELNEVYDLTIEDNSNYYLDCNKLILVHNSSKTWDAIHFIVTYCDHNKNKNKDIYIMRDTLTNCRDFTLKEFEKCFKIIGLPFNPLSLHHKPFIKLFGNNIYFRGLDDEATTEGFPSHLIFVNEMLETKKSQIAGLLMRCEDCFIADWNPKFTDHWAFDFEKRPNCLFTHSTYKNNKYLKQSLIDEFESYDPNNPINIQNGTADEYRHKVYAQGQRASPQGVVFPKVTYIDAFPEDIDEVAYGLDFGTTAQTAIVKLGLRKNTPKSDLFLQKLFYLPTESSSFLIDVIKKLNIDKHIWCDNNKPAWITDMRNANIDAFPTRKFPGSRDYWISSIKNFNIHIVKDPDFRKEQENFRYRVVDGIQLSETIKKYDHCFAFDTKITTSKGLINISEIKKGDEVLTSKGFNKVLATFNNGIKELFVYRMNFSTFAIEIKCTNNHLFKTQSGWRQISQIKKGDVLFLNNLYFAQSHVVQSIQEVSCHQQTAHDLMVDLQHEYFANGILVHNCWSASGYGVVGDFRQSS